MSCGCRHDPLNACAPCLEEMNAGRALVIETNLKPEPGETLEKFQRRVNAEHLLAGLSPEIAPATTSGYIEPSLEEQKRIIKDASIPEPVRRFWRERLYGKGGSGRKALQQERAARREKSLVSNLQDRAMTGLCAIHGNVTPKVRPKGMSGRQWKMAKRLLRQAAKVVQNAGE